MKKSIFIIGCGFLGKATADLLFHKGWVVRGACATQAGLPQQHQLYPVEVCNVSQIASLKNFSPTPPDVVLFCASSRGGGENAYRDLYFQGVRNLITVWPSTKLLFTSSTSVYAQTHGEIVDENSPTEPNQKGQILLRAEQEVLASGGVVARFAGIYGPTRSMHMRKFLAGQAVLENGGHRWMNQIHRDDGARALEYLTQASSGIYNISDNRPATQYEIYQWLADFFKRPLPPEGPISSERKREWTSKRVSNQKMKGLQWIPQWESYQDAIEDLSFTG